MTVLKKKKAFLICIGFRNVVKRDRILFVKSFLFPLPLKLNVLHVINFGIKFQLGKKDKFRKIILKNSMLTRLKRNCT